MERGISVGATEMMRQVKVDHLQSCSRIFRSDQTKLVHTIKFDVPTEISRILGWMEVPFIEMYMCMIIINNTKFNDYEIANKICVLLFYFVVLGNWTRRCFGSQVYRVVMEES